jgi:putative transposase
MSWFWELKSLAFTRHFRYANGMDHDRRTAHARLEVKHLFAWITEYRKKLLAADVVYRAGQLVRDGGSAQAVEIVKGQAGENHVHLFVSGPPHVS